MYLTTLHIACKDYTTQGTKETEGMLIHMENKELNKTQVNVINQLTIEL